ncbi:hypothetical protein MKAN_26955 [Mycobacterium kansasii ATCC 12478]|uniref:Uncharacterized protein n=1 Tax=Mycobacterium kansasii ATCC 12478 TaxID=557599 RepID=U5WZ26_MYCKA|nr:hypothetical protein MKAN_26955 [Mycobacterium kansasii ATCC 12478]
MQLFTDAGQDHVRADSEAGHIFGGTNESQEM